MPRLVRLYITQTLVGFAVAAGFTALLIGFNVAHLRHLVTHVEGGYLAAFLLFMFNGIVFSGVQFGIRLVLMDSRNGDGPQGTAPQHAADEMATLPIPVRRH